MVNYIVRRMGYALIMLVLVSFASFVIINLPQAISSPRNWNNCGRGDRSRGQTNTAGL
jgi:uncharacterized membrane protein